MRLIFIFSVLFSTSFASANTFGAMEKRLVTPAVITCLVKDYEHPDHVISGSCDGWIKRWNVKTGQEQQIKQYYWKSISDLTWCCDHENNISLVALVGSIAYFFKNATRITGVAHLDSVLSSSEPKNRSDPPMRLEKRTTTPIILKDDTQVEALGNIIHVTYKSK